MKLSKTQLRRIIREEKRKLTRSKKVLREFSHLDEEAHTIVDMIVEKACNEGLVADEDAWRLQEIVENVLLGGQSGDPFRFSQEDY